MLFPLLMVYCLASAGNLLVPTAMPASADTRYPIDQTGLPGVRIVYTGTEPPRDATRFLGRLLERQGQDAADDHSLRLLRVTDHGQSGATSPSADLPPALEVEEIPVSKLDENSTDAARAADILWVDCSAAHDNQTILQELVRDYLAEEQIVVVPLWLAQADSESGDSQSYRILPGFSQVPARTDAATRTAKSSDQLILSSTGDIATVISGRRLFVLGEGTLTVRTADVPGGGRFEKVLESGDSADLLQLLRAAKPANTNQGAGHPPSVPTGALVIVGGGGMPEDVVNRYIDLAGGPEARIVVLPTAVPPDVAARTSVPSFLRNADIADVQVLPQMTPDEIASPEFQSTLKQATGLWFGGGRQWHFLDAYEQTNAIELFRDVLRRGGVIGGSSAGATIQGDYLVRGHPLTNVIMMTPGYEQGFSFLPGVAIDQHFGQRGRLKDLLPVIHARPEFLGIGIDEATALIVQGDKAEVLGRHHVRLLRSTDLDQRGYRPEDTYDNETAEPFYLRYESGEEFSFSHLPKLAPLASEPNDAD